MKKITIVFQAIPFCFGPGAQTLAISNQLKSLLGRKLELIALASGTTYEFLKMSNSFDKIYEYSTEKPKIPKRIKSVLMSADKIICIGDFKFIDKVYAIRRKVEFVDPLFWMWDEFPTSIDHCNRYYAVDFLGVKERVNEYSKSFPNHLKPTIVNQICEYSSLSKNRNSGILLVQFGGIQNPMGQNIDLVVAMINEILESIKDMQHFKKIIIRGGSKAMDMACNKIIHSDPRVEIGASNHENFLNELSSCEVLLTIPGMSIVYEAFASKCPLIFILPLNYSQHRQMVAYKKMFKNVKSIMWEDFLGYHTLPEQMPEEQAIREAIKLGAHFSNDPKARLQFREKVIDLLTFRNYKPLRAKHDKIKVKKIKIDGANEIARNLIKDLSFKVKI